MTRMWETCQTGSLFHLTGANYTSMPQGWPLPQLSIDSELYNQTAHSHSAHADSTATDEENHLRNTSEANLQQLSADSPPGIFIPRSSTS